MRPVLVVAISCSMAAQVAMGQGWDYQFERPGLYTYFADAVEANGSWLIASNTVTLPDTTPKELRLVRLDSDGIEINCRRLWGELSDVGGAAILVDPAGTRLHLLGTFADDQGRQYLHHYGMDATGAGTDSSLTALPSYYHAGMNNACAARNGTIMAEVSGLTSPEALFDIGSLVKLSNAGDSITSRQFVNPNMFLPRHIVETAEDTFLLASLGTPYYTVDNASGCSYLRFTGTLDTLGSFYPSALVNDGTETTPGNTLNDHLHMCQLPSGNLAVGGRIGTLSSGMHAAVEKLSGTGEHLGAFAPESEFTYDYPGIYGTLDTTTDGNLLFAYMANYQPGPPTPLIPTEPGRIHIYKLDTSLNVLCTNVLDGFQEDAFYWLNRIKATSDGGYLLIGGRVDTSDPEARMVGWIRKYGPEDCFTGMDNASWIANVTVFPNPAVSELRFILNGPAQNGRVDLYDMSGRSVGSAPLLSGHALFAVGPLAIGVYGYRIHGMDGRPLAIGKWTKL